ncbi:MAG TPA: response regulator [Vicinamibacterales bacterium]
MRVLVVEDESALSAQLASALREAGYVVDCAADGERADFLGQTEIYDAVVLDLGLPKVDGLTVLGRWRDARVSVPVLVLTARDSWHEKVRGIDGGADFIADCGLRIADWKFTVNPQFNPLNPQFNPQSAIRNPKFPMTGSEGTC